MGELLANRTSSLDALRLTRQSYSAIDGRLNVGRQQGSPCSRRSAFALEHPPAELRLHAKPASLGASAGHSPLAAYLLGPPYV